jgi:hypothetical protein
MHSPKVSTITRPSVLIKLMQNLPQDRFQPIVFPVNSISNLVLFIPPRVFAQSLCTVKQQMVIAFELVRVPVGSMSLEVIDDINVSLLLEEVVAFFTIVRKLGEFGVGRGIRLGGGGGGGSGSIAEGQSFEIGQGIGL